MTPINLWRRTYIPPNLTKVGIVYGKKSGHVRRHIYPSQGDEGFIPHETTLLDGEALCFVPIACHHAGHAVFHRAIRESVQIHGGVRAVLFADDPGSRMFARVNPLTGYVDNITMADPDVPSDLHVIMRDNWMEFTLSEGIGIGWFYSTSIKKFWRPMTIEKSMNWVRWAA